MHNLTKIKIFRFACLLTFPLAAIFIYPFVLMKRKNKSHLFFFFDRYAIGGAQRIHLDILNAVEDTYKQVYFTRKSVNTSLKEAFYSIPNTSSLDIHFWCDHLLFRLFTVHFYAFYLNRHQKAHILSANSTFFYDLLPFLKSSHIKIELLHNFTHGKKGMEFFGLANHRTLTYRIVYDSFTLKNIKEQYAQYKVPSSYLNNILFIEPGVEVPPSLFKEYASPLILLYAGRGGPQKRIHLINKIAEHCIKENWALVFHFAGTMTDELSQLVKENAVLHGSISDKEEMNKLYKQSHVILMTSIYEGFPMLIKEGMAYGCIPVVTALEGNKMHLINGENALLIDAIENEEEVVQNGIDKIEMLLKNQSMVEFLSRKAYNYAQSKFTKGAFIADYRKLLLFSKV